MVSTFPQPLLSFHCLLVLFFPVVIIIPLEIICLSSGLRFLSLFLPSSLPPSPFFLLSFSFLFSDPGLLWLWCRPRATALIRLLAWEPPYASGMALKSKTNQKKRNMTSRLQRLNTKAEGEKTRNRYVTDDCNIAWKRQGTGRCRFR